MTGEVVDPSGSSPPRHTTCRYESLRIRRLRASALVSARRIQVTRPAPACCAFPLWPNQRIAPWIPRFPQATTHEFPHHVIGLQPTMAAAPDQPMPLYQPLIPSQTNAFVINPQPTNSYEPWTPQEHGVFLMGLIKYGKGRWRKIAKDFCGNKTTEQVQIHANHFYRHLQTTYVFNYKRRCYPTYARASVADLSINENLAPAPSVYASASAPPPPPFYNPVPVPVPVTKEPLPAIYNSNASSLNPMAAIHSQPSSSTFGFAPSFEPMAQVPSPSNLNLFPVEAPLFPVSPNGGVHPTGGAPVGASNNGHVDLELRLG